MEALTHKYANLSEEELVEWQSNFLIDSWSYSKVESYARNEKAFEMSYIYRERAKFGATTAAGQAYHEALEHFFTAFYEDRMLDVTELERVAFLYIEELPSNYWKLQKTTPTIDDCKEKALKTATALIRNFYGEIDVYLEEIARVLSVEYKFKAWLTINGVDIPLPCSMVIDLVVELHDGRIVIIDHKSKAAHSDEKELKLSIGKQAITYVNGYEAKTGRTISQVWFIENKYSQNRDKTKKQLNVFVVDIDKDTRRLYEALLYEPLKRMVEAVSDPDYVYIINSADNYVDQADLNNFWCKTMTAEIEEFNVPDNKKEIIEKRLKKIRDASLATIDPKIIRTFKKSAASFIQYDLSNTDMTPSEKIEHVLRTFGIISEVKNTHIGYSSNTYLLDLSAGTSIKNIYSKRLDIANALDVKNVRILPDLVVFEDKSYVGIESEKKREKNLIFDPSKLEGFKIPIGVNNFGETLVWDWENQSTPHALVGGGTGSGKTVFMRSTLEYALLTPVEEIIILDPKYEFLGYASDRVRVINEVEDIEVTAKELVEDMNERVKAGVHKWTFVIFDEFTDAYMNAKSGKALDIIGEVEEGYYKQSLEEQLAGLPPQPKTKKKVIGKENSLQENMQMLLQKGRSSGFRILQGTQRADSKVIDGNAKVNMPVQICFLVNRAIDSKVIIDEIGAEALAGYGDGLFRSPQYRSIERFQSFWKDEK